MQLNGRNSLPGSDINTTDFSLPRMETGQTPLKDKYSLCESSETDNPMTISDGN